MELIKEEYKKAFEHWAIAITDSSMTARLVETVGKGFREVKTDTIDAVDWKQLNKDSWVLLFNDFDFTATRELLAHDITNIIMVSTDFSNEQTVNKYFFNIVYPNTVIKMLVGDKLPWKAVLQLKRTELKNKKGKETGEYIYTLEGDHKEYMAKEFDSIIANFPFSFGNDLTKFIIETVNFKDGCFAEVLPISKLKKGTLTQYVIPGTIKNNTVKRQASDFDGAYTYPIIFRVSKTKTNDLSFEDFERLHCCNRAEGLGKKFFEEQDRRIKEEQDGTRKKAFKRHICVLRLGFDRDSLDINTVVSTAHWTPCIAHGWGAQEIFEDDKTKTFKNNNYTQWNFKTVNKPYKELFNETATGTNQTITEMNTSAGKDHIVNWMHSAELNDKYRHCGLFTILLRWMNKTTGCPYDYILPRVDFDSREWTDEEILADYGYTPEEIEQVLHYNDDLIPESWKKAHPGK